MEDGGVSDKGGPEGLGQGIFVSRWHEDTRHMGMPLDSWAAPIAWRLSETLTTPHGAAPVESGDTLSVAPLVWSIVLLSTMCPVDEKEECGSDWHVAELAVQARITSLPKARRVHHSARRPGLPIGQHCLGPRDDLLKLSQSRLPTPHTTGAWSPYQARLESVSKASNPRRRHPDAPGISCPTFQKMPWRFLEAEMRQS